MTTKAKKSIAAFKVREGMPIGAMVTLRGGQPCTSSSIALSLSLFPASATSVASRRRVLMARGNYTLGLRDQLIFAEIDYAKVGQLKGMNVHHRHDGEG